MSPRYLENSFRSVVRTNLAEKEGFEPSRQYPSLLPKQRSAFIIRWCYADKIPLSGERWPFRLLSALRRSYICSTDTLRQTRLRENFIRRAIGRSKLNSPILRRSSVFIENRRFFIPLKEVIFMAYVPVPKDLSRVKTKVMLNLTKRQLLCFGLAAIAGVPLFFLLKPHTSVSVAALMMVLAMLPFLCSLFTRKRQAR